MLLFGCIFFFLNHESVLGFHQLTPATELPKFRYSSTILNDAH